jgi:hypothetical protein
MLKLTSEAILGQLLPTPKSTHEGSTNGGLGRNPAFSLSGVVLLKTD